MGEGGGRQVAGVVASTSGLDAAEFRAETLRRLRQLVPIDAAFYATVDPVTLLFTSAMADDPLGAATPRFLDNEFGQPDVNKFADLADATDKLGTLDRATRGDRITSPRYRDVLRPLGLGDELRVALVAGGQCWGVLCLHREDGPTGFGDDEIDLVRQLGPSLGEGLRRSLTVGPPSQALEPGGPGVVVLDTDLTVLSINEQADVWLHDLRPEGSSRHPVLPVSILAAAARLAIDAQPSAAPAATRLQTTKGAWLTVRTSILQGSSGPQIAVIIEPANQIELSSLLLAAHGLTPAQQRVAALVLQGWSTHRIVHELHISTHTLQEHLGAVFERFGIGSRRELVAALSGHR
ncbi:MAG TPA: GAF domain-containing protein [Acidimicrobiales bacterium]